ncbi:MAG TPA: hypoxanthine phosphoribosyltransferase [Bdellovibrionales bacterium]|mgnify:CR=1 FL=1|nr:hypoxanthine phosphoribosyltransferase [Bdellovibrionales bacterium]
MQMREGMIPTISKDEISEMVSELAREIERDYEGKEIVLICPLKGSVLFMADLSRKLNLQQIIDFVSVTSPKGESCRILKDITVDIQNKHVLILEEIIDAGRTLSFLKARLMASNPASLKVVALLDKPALRELPIRPDYVGRTIEDRFVIGYGMDSEEIGRNYADIYNFTQ